ncbi:MAG: hypothetical protein R3A44_00985 [Caldilineaceae bacterium]
MSKKYLRLYLFPLTAYTLLAIWMTWPLAARLGMEIPVGLGGDAWAHQWTFWWVKRALSQGLNPYQTDLLFYPDGASLIFHNFAWVNIALWLPLQSFWGNLAAYGLTYIILFALNGCALYWLLYDWTGSTSAALMGGVVHATWPYLLSQTGHPNMITVMWIPLAILFMRRTFARQRTGDALLTALFLALTGFSRWQLLISGGLALGIYVIYALISQPAYRTRRVFWQMALIGGVTLLLLAPLGTSVFAALLQPERRADISVDESLNGSDLLAYLIPNANSWLGALFVEKLPYRLRFTRDQVDFVGWVTLVLAMLGVWRKWRQARLWVIMAGVYWLLALGPDLLLGNAKYAQIFMPYRLVQDFFAIKIIRDAHRFNAFLALPVAMLCGLATSTPTPFLNRVVSGGKGGKAAPSLLRGRVSAAVSAALILLVILEHWIYPYRLSTFDVPAWYTQLAQEPGDFGLLELPMDHRQWDKEYMRYQMVHEKPLAQGHISRPTRDAYRLLESTPFLSRLHAENQMDWAIGDVTHQLRTLTDAHIRYLVLHKAFAEPGQIDEWRRWLVYAPVHEDDELVVFATAPLYGRDFTIGQPLTDAVGLLALDSNLAALDGRIMQAGTVQLAATWGSRAALGRVYQSCLFLDGPAQERYCFDLGGAWPAQKWTDSEIVRETYNAQISPFIEPGDYALRLGLVEQGSRQPVGQQVALGNLTVLPIARNYNAPGMANPVDAAFGDALTLLGYDLSEGDGEISLMVYWQARRQMAHSYKIFAHLLDANGQRAAQHDAVPHQWAYPTTQWDTGEVVADRVALKLDDANAPRPYQIVLGVYDEQTGERLAVVDANGVRAAEDALLLATLR